MNILRVRL